MKKNDSLHTYSRKRKLKESKEPAARVTDKRKEHLSFVVQRHDATTLHYDFRLEADGVLKSWAIPKGPSMDPLMKRLAVMVEDHPLAYGKFEGEIPEGHYGAGTVEIWDAGWYAPVDATEDQNTLVLEHLHKGSLKFGLHGKKLKGIFSIVRMKGTKNWLLIKSNDEYAKEE